MPKQVLKYERIKTSVSDQKTLRDAGYTPFFSSNVSAGQRDGTDLYIRFHNGSVYRYPNKGKEFNDLLLAPSKGKWVWANLRRPNASFVKVGGFPLQGDRDFTDEELFTELKQRTNFEEVLNLVGTEEQIKKSSLGLVDSVLLSTVINAESLFNGIIASQIVNII